MNLSERITKFGLKRAAALTVAFGLLTMAFDAGLSHFAGRPLKHPAQLIPVAFGALVIGLAGPLLAGDERRLFHAARVLAGTAVVMGVVGSAFHVIALCRLLTTGGAVDLSLVGVALSIAPPLFAPGAFVGLGAALWALASPRVGLTLARQPREILAAA